MNRSRRSIVIVLGSFSVAIIMFVSTQKLLVAIDVGKSKHHLMTIATVANGIEQFRLDHGQYPRSLDDLESTFTRSDELLSPFQLFSDGTSYSLVYRSCGPGPQPPRTWCSTWELQDDQWISWPEGVRTEDLERILNSIHRQRNLE